MFGWSPHYGGRQETLGAVAATSRGTTMTVGASNTKGSYVNLGTTGFDYHSLAVFITRSSAAQDMCIDLSIDSGAGGNNFIIAPDLRYFNSSTSAGTAAAFILPLYVASGSLIDVRAAASGIGTPTVDCIVIGSSNGLFGLPGFSRAIALYSAAGPNWRGVDIDPGATVNTEGAYAQLTASSSDAIAAFTCSLGPGGDVARAATTSWLVDIATGAAASEFNFLTDLPTHCTGSVDMPVLTQHGLWACDIPSGTRFAARCQSDSNTAGDRILDVAAWGFVK